MPGNGLVSVVSFGALPACFERDRAAKRMITEGPNAISITANPQQIPMKLTSPAEHSPFRRMMMCAATATKSSSTLPLIRYLCNLMPTDVGSSVKLAK